MSWVNDVVADYGRALGIDHLALNEQGVVSLHFERSGDFFIEHADDSVLIYLVRELDRPTEEAFATALEQCHWTYNHPFAVNASLRGDRHLVFSVCLEENELDVPAIERIQTFLESLHRAEPSKSP